MGVACGFSVFRVAGSALIAMALVCSACKPTTIQGVAKEDAGTDSSRAGAPGMPPEPPCTRELVRRARCRMWASRGRLRRSRRLRRMRSSRDVWRQRRAGTLRLSADELRTRRKELRKDPGRLRRASRLRTLRRRRNVRSRASERMRRRRLRADDLRSRKASSAARLPTAATTPSTAAAALAPETCGGAGDEKRCGCTPRTCEDLRAECGEARDGCGGMARLRFVPAARGVRWLGRSVHLRVRPQEHVPRNGLRTHRRRLRRHDRVRRLRWMVSERAMRRPAPENSDREETSRERNRPRRKYGGGGRGISQVSARRRASTRLTSTNRSAPRPSPADVFSPHAHSPLVRAARSRHFTGAPRALFH